MGLVRSSGDVNSMKVLFLPYCKSNFQHEITKAINNHPMKCNCQHDEKECATCEYSEHHDKFIFHKDCPVTLKDIRKSGGQSLGNGMSKGTINKKDCCWIVFKGGSDVSRKNIETILKIIKTEDMKKRKEK